MTLIERLDIYEKLTRLDKPIGILLLLWPTLWGLWLASAGSPNPYIAAIFVMGVVLIRLFCARYAFRSTSQVTHRPP